VGVDGTGNQFMGFVTGAFPHNNYPDLDQDWRGIKRWYAVMHHFGADGNHLRTEAWCAGTSADDFEVGRLRSNGLIRCSARSCGLYSDPSG